jgi:serine/threonine protein kinase
MAKYVIQLRLILTSCHQGFARKIIRITSRTARTEIESEARVISSLFNGGGHGNIVAIQDHGWLKLSPCYFIDMELCDLTLRDYIDYHYGSSVATIVNINDLTPVFVSKHCSLVARIQNMWTIGTHIARGLEFMHVRSYVHRDLKPSNGTLRAFP